MDKSKLKTGLNSAEKFKSGVPQNVDGINKQAKEEPSSGKSKPESKNKKASFFKNFFKPPKQKITKKNNNSSKQNPELEKLDQKISLKQKDLEQKIKDFQAKKKKIKTRLKEQRSEIKALWVEQKKETKKLNTLKQKYSKKIIQNKEIIPYFTSEKPNLKENIIELNQAFKYYIIGSLKNVVIDNISLKIKRDKIISILGPSGSGKTTLLNLMSGLDTVNRGDVFVDGYNLSLLKDSDLTLFRRKKIAFIFQQYNLLPHLTAKENAEVGENLADKKKSSLSLNKIFETIEMTDHMDKYPYQLSGGQQQRISIARALAKNPAILFCDEPTGALDEKTGKKVLEILVKINQEFKTTIIIVTHNPAIAEISDYMIKIHDGKIDDEYENKIKKNPQDILWA